MGRQRHSRIQVDLAASATSSDGYAWTRGFKQALEEGALRSFEKAP